MQYAAGGRDHGLARYVRRYLTMKLKSDFATQNIDDTLFLIPVGADDFNGIIRSNPTAAFIINLLKEDTTKEDIVGAICRKYEVSEEEVEKDVEEILDTLRKIHALEE